MTRFVLAIAFVLIAHTGFCFGEEKKALFTVISETGVPHSAVLLEYPDGTKKWLGFKPKGDKMPIDDGKIDEADTTKNVSTYVRFKVDAAKLKTVEEAVRKEFAGKTYFVTKYDCVNLSVAFAEGLNLKVPGKPNLLPSSLVENLTDLNKDLKPVSGNNKAPFPWVK